MPALMFIVVLLIVATIIYFGFIRKSTDTKEKAVRSVARTFVWLFVCCVAVFVMFAIVFGA